MADRRPLKCSLLGIVSAIFAGFLGWLTSGATTTARECASGSGGSTLEVALFLALVALAPAMVVAAAWRWKLPLYRAVPAAIAVALIALFSVFMGDQIWWSAHNCIT